MALPSGEMLTMQYREYGRFSAVRELFIWSGIRRRRLFVLHKECAPVRYTVYLHSPFSEYVYATLGFSSRAPSISTKKGYEIIMKPGEENIISLHGL